MASWRAFPIGSGRTAASCATADETFERKYANFDWSEPPGDPGAQGIFGAAVYQRGAMTVHALRKTIGDDAFFRLLRSWPADQRDGNATTAEFTAAAETVSGRDLDSFFQAWLFGTTQPPRP